MSYDPGSIVQLSFEDTSPPDRGRPFLIIGRIVVGYLIVPLTTSERHADRLVPIPKQVGGATEDSYAKVGNPRTTWDGRIHKKIGTVDPDILSKVREEVGSILEPVFGRELV